MAQIILQGNSVSGTIYDAHDAPLAGVAVSAYDKDLRSEQLLGEAVTDEKGQYAIGYDDANFAAAENKSADIFIRVRSNEGTPPEELGKSEVYFNVPAAFTLDFKIGGTPYAGLSEFDALVQIVQPLVEAQHLKIADLKEDEEFQDVRFLAGETGEPAEKIALLPLAYRLAEEASIDAAIFYGLFRLQYPKELNALMLVSSESIRKGITEAIRLNIISSKWEEAIEKTLAKFNRFAREFVLTGEEEDNVAFKKLIGAVILKAEMQEAVMDTYFVHEAAPDQFWEALATRDGFTDGIAATALKKVLQLNHLTDNVPALSVLLYQEQREDPELSEMRGFAKFSQADWENRITQLVASGELVKFPAGIKGETPEEKAQNYAEGLAGVVHQLYPTDVFAWRMSNDSGHPFGDTKRGLDAFFSNNPDFDLQANEVNSQFEEADFEGIENKEATQKELQSIHRLYKLYPHYEAVSALRKEGVDSAAAIVQKYSAGQFAEIMEGSIGRETAMALYNKAKQTDNYTTALALKYKMGRDIQVYAINGALEASSDYQSMFGDNNLCDCEHCRSVYSPSAYLVDILNFLRRNKLQAFEELVGSEAKAGRRPDLADILLTCKNTNTPLPYIDLANEVLEGHITGNLAAHQTNDTARALAAYPEHVNDAAYDLLKAADYSFHLPLHLGLEETRIFLDKLKVKRYALMELFFGKKGATKYNDVAIAAEYLQLSKQELEIINGATGATSITMEKVGDFLQYTGLAYLEMLQLLECYFINPENEEGDGRAITIVAEINEENDNALTCDIQFLRFEGIDENTPNKALRFLRLWKKLGWNMLDLDKVFTALGIKAFDASPEEVNAQLIIPLSHIARIKGRLGLSVPVILALWSTIDTKVYLDHSKEGQPSIPSLYEKLFQNKQVANPIDEDFANPHQLAGTLSSKSALLISALNISQSEFDQLVQPPISNGDLNLENLSVLFRYATLAKAAKMQLDDLIQAIGLSGIDPFEKSGDTLLFLEKISLIRSSRISLNELNALLKNNPANLRRPDLNKMAEDLSAIREGLKKIEGQFPGADDDSEQAAAKGRNQSTFLADTFSNSFQTESKLADVLLHELVRFPANPTQAAITPFIYEGFIASEGPVFSITETGEFTGFAHVVDTYFSLFEHWARIKELMGLFRLSTEEAIYFYRNATALKLNGLWQAPSATLDNGSFTAFENLAQLIRFRDALPKPRLNDWYILFDHVLAGEADSKQQSILGFAELANAVVPTVEFLLGIGADVNEKGVLNFSFPDDYTNGAYLLNVVDCMKTAGKLGSTAESLWRLTPQDIGLPEAQLAKSLLKSKYEEAAWLEAIKPVSDQLRAKKRDALVAYILTAPQMDDYRNNNAIIHSDSLFEYFLIDAEMAPCMMTSRVKQAVSSVQLFVGRCLMGLEPGISLTPEFAGQWNQWRKWYRIWEANRKVFLYPENWIEPELRDDKTPFFKELEAKLLQNEVTDEVAEGALNEYLRKLDTVANLEVIGFFPDELTGIVHVIGRTKAVPHHYYYRKREKFIWSPWEKVDLDIEGDHIILVVWNNRLMLFWGVFAEKQEEKDEMTIPPLANGGQISQARKYLEIKLAWSEYKKEKWGSKKISQDGSSVGLNYKKSFSLSSNIIDNILTLNVIFWTNENFAHLDRFIFDGCNNSPYLIEVGYGFPVYRRTSPGLNANNMFFKNSSDIYNFSIFKGGVFEIWSSTDEAINNLEEVFQDVSLDYQVLPNHHEITKEKPLIFFYNNTQSNFYVRLKESIRAQFPDDDLVATPGSLIARRTIEPVLINSFASTLETVQTPIEPSDSPLLIDGFSDQPLLAYDPPFVSFFKRHYQFETFYHPYVCDYIKTLNTYGIDGLYQEEMQNQMAQEFSQQYRPTPVVQRPYPVEEVDFSIPGAYSIYNWELFFHIPLLIATRLSQNQKFDAARRWFHYIFDPSMPSTSSGAGPERFWITKPFKREIRDGLPTVEELINDEDNRVDLEAQVKNWAENPFKPHAVARMRLSAYMRTTVMKYIDNLVSWGDQLFRRDTIESINEATQLYILAANILGQKPPGIPPRAKPEEQSFSSVQDQLDSFGNAKVAVESFLSHSDLSETGTLDEAMLMPMFCIPQNGQLLGYWDTVADRLFKIRNCMNIEGVVRQLPLFEPPIDPALLVRANALGLDLNSILDDLRTQLPNYRFQVMLQKANELCNDVKGLGSQLLSVLEKRDAEALSLLRSGQEMKLLDLLGDIKKNQVEEAKENMKSLNASRNVIEERRIYYDSREFMNGAETLNFFSNNVSLIFQQAKAEANAAASTFYSGPDFKVGGPFTVGSYYGGTNLGNAAKSSGNALDALALINSIIGSMAGTLGSYQRRQDDWDFQAKSAELELKQIDKQITAAEIRLAIAEKDLENHGQQIENAKEIDEFLRDKFTNEALYSYMVGQISSIYFQSYQLAYEMARKAESCYQHELGEKNTPFIQFGYWDSLKKGLLSGEKLQYDLRRLEMAYLENNQREFEMAKNLSLATLDPVALINLRENGECFVKIPEVLFDLDHPGHYMRRIKSVALTIPCVTGPYTNVSCKLTLGDNQIRKSSDLLPESNDSPYAYVNLEDARFIHNLGVKESIATSSAQNDSGLFVLDFRDERYLPFEGAGVISQWKIELPNEFRLFDYKTISDVIFQIRYTARDGGDELKAAAISGINDIVEDENQEENGLIRLFSARHDFSSDWHRFLNPAGNVSSQVLELDLTKERFPFLARNKEVQLHTAILFLKLKAGIEYGDNNTDNLMFDLTKEGGPEFADQEFIMEGSPVPGLPHTLPFQDSTQGIGKWRMEVTESRLANLPEGLTKTVAIEGVEHIRLNQEAIEDVFIVFHYSILSAS